MTAVKNLEIGEEFGISGMNKNCLFRLTDKAFEWRFNDSCSEWRPADNSLILDLLSGKKKIINKPWKPKSGDDFFYVTANGKIIYSNFSVEDTISMALYVAGNCFRTREEAEKNKEEVLSRLKTAYETGRESSEVGVVDAAHLLKKYCQERGGNCTDCKFADKEPDSNKCFFSHRPDIWRV